MGKVEAFEIEGLEAWFNSQDHHPPHLHIRRRGEWEIRVFFLECSEGRLNFELKWGQRRKRRKKGPSPQAQASILDEVLKHRTELLLEWERKVCTP